MIIELIKENSTWFFSGLGVVILSFVAKILFPKWREASGATIINIHGAGSNKEKKSSESNSTKEERMKDTTRILFIDDQHTKFKIISILKTAGWKNTKSVKDITDLDDLKAKEADIIFVDINGVGKSLFADEGLGLASALKVKYPSKKVVLYSAETKGDRFHKALKEVDASLSKDAEPYQFIHLIESLCQ